MSDKEYFNYTLITNNIKDVDAFLETLYNKITENRERTYTYETVEELSKQDEVWLDIAKLMEEQPNKIFLAYLTNVFPANTKVNLRKLYIGLEKNMRPMESSNVWRGSLNFRACESNNFKIAIVREYGSNTHEPGNELQLLFLIAKK